ncbi:MAG: TIGR03667 family PPOX class F420-dependent oxidoreductase [Candidatus Dormibacterales bacterium]
MEPVRFGSHVRSRLRKEIVIWLATSGRNGTPHAVPVWFWWDGTSFLVYSVPGQKVRDVEANPNVQLHLNTDPEGNDVVRIDGLAHLARDETPAFRVPAYVRKYRTYIKDLGWTPKTFSGEYSVAIRILPARLH